MRIISGEARGRRFDAPEGMDTRPTLARVKESMFGILQFDIPYSQVLDLFSGSGNLGLEAASRGASGVVCNDHSRSCAELIRKNAVSLRLDDRVQVLQMEYGACIERLSGEGRKMDIVFIDAPYEDGTAEKAAALLLEKGMLKEGGRIVIEHGTNLPPKLPEQLCEIVTTRHYGDCAITIVKGKES